MKVYFITRFSIYDPNKKAWVISRLPQQQYFNKLFSEDRLNAKFTAFEKMTLPTVLNQTNKNYEWLILSSVHLPEIYKKRLNDLVAPHPQIKVYYVNNWEEVDQILKTYPYEPSYATVRLDDDDGLSPNYVQMLQQYKDKRGCIITFPYGTGYKIENGNIIYKEGDICCNCIALGLTAINMNIYSCGNHTKLKDKYTIIKNNTRGMYYLFFSKYCDSGRMF